MEKGIPSKPTFELPEVSEKELTYLQPGEYGEIKKSLDKINAILYGIVFAVILAMISILVSVIGLFLDQMRYNNAAYKEYKTSSEVTNHIIETNNELIQMVGENQQAILGLEKYIQNSLK